MKLGTKRIVIAGLSAAFLLSLLFVQWMEVARKREEAGITKAHITVPASSKACVECHDKSSPGIIEHWKGSTHARKGVGCVECHKADAADADRFEHYGETIATVVTPRDCGRCHTTEASEFGSSHHAKAGNILASLDNYLAETVEGARVPFNPHSQTPGFKTTVDKVNGMASVNSGCRQCHGAKIGIKATDGTIITVDDLKPGADGKPTNTAILVKIERDQNGKPKLDPATWPNTGIGRINLDGSLGSCSACHSRHDFYPRRARQPENCGKCHLGPDHPQEEIYNESKHGVAFRDLREKMNLDSSKWVLGKDYSQAPTCATCHMSGHTRNGGKVTHDPGERISWTNRPPISLMMDTDKDHKVLTEIDPVKRQPLVADTWEAKRTRMRDVCTHCHSPDYVSSFYKQYDDFIVNFNEKFAKPGAAIMSELRKQGLLTKPEFDEQIEWTWYFLWHHEGRRARHGAAMMAPDYSHWHGMFEVADRFYMHFIPEAREVAKAAAEAGKLEQAKAAMAAIDAVLKRPEHAWFEKDKPYDSSWLEPKAKETKDKPKP
jgi:hydroxylamine dehydrogenase